MPFVALLAVLLAAVLPFGGVYVTSLPSGADVWIDGSYIGRTPVLIDGLRTGKHAITITKAGWRVAEVDQDIAAATTTATNVDLSPLNPPMARGSIELHGLDSSAKVAFDHQKWQALSAHYDLPAGGHHVSIKETQGKFERDVTIYPDQTTHVVFRAPASEAHSAVVAALDNYIPVSAAKITGDRLVVKWGGHTVTGKLGDSKFVVDGRPIVYDAPAGMVSGKLYLPLDLIQSITGSKTK
ncbi:MAG TPA: PEGA domain-containing protein [Candidatus Baltobacteraceae bacterium]|nr:PEGA domain-containing protein [Candidatus Baltobacteraceae bacterium]